MQAVRQSAGPGLLKFTRLTLCPGRHYQHAAAQSEYTETPEYPPILDTSRKARKLREATEWHDKITRLPTVEQKMMEMNMPKYYGYWSCRLHDNHPRLLGEEFVQYATRTHVVRRLPHHYHSDLTLEAQRLGALITDQVHHLIDLHFNGRINRKMEITSRANELHHTKNFLLGLHRIIVSSLPSTVQHIKESMVDIQPRVEAFWLLGGIEPDVMLKKSRRNNKFLKEFENDLINRPVQGTSTPCLGVRVADFLPEVVSRDDPLSKSGLVSNSSSDPRSYGFHFKHKHAITVTGFWPGEAKEHSQLWMHTREILPKFVQEFGAHNFNTALIQKVVISSFTQALAHASYLGFGPVTELTYPLVQQSVLTNGQQWHFSMYQLNTSTLHCDRAEENPYNNILWLGEEQFLFEAVDDSGVKGFNSEVLTALISLFLKKGIKRENPTPYLGSNKLLADHPARKEYREMFHTYLQHLFSGRPRHILKPEIYLWEQIYKINFKTRPFHPPRRFFEPHYNQKDPGSRRLDDYDPIYIPKALREKKSYRYKPKLNTEHLYTYD
nr:28S ribosomal protein S30, mitochondrial-like [Procambarus clarkii]